MCSPRVSLLVTDCLSKPLLRFGLSFSGISYILNRVNRVRTSVEVSFIARTSSGLPSRRSGTEGLPSWHEPTEAAPHHRKWGGHAIREAEGEEECCGCEYYHANVQCILLAGWVSASNIKPRLHWNHGALHFWRCKHWWLQESGGELEREVGGERHLGSRLWPQLFSTKRSGICKE